MGAPGVEPGTSPLSGVRSSHLSYAPNSIANSILSSDGSESTLLRRRTHVWSRAGRRFDRERKGILDGISLLIRSLSRLAAVDSRNSLGPISDGVSKNLGFEHFDLVAEAEYPHDDIIENLRR